jgi:hypothetical protein
VVRGCYHSVIRFEEGIILERYFPNLFVRGPHLASQNDHESAIFAYVSKESPDVTCQELSIDISELMAYSY